MNRGHAFRERGMGMVDGAQNLTEQAHKQGIIPDREYAFQTYHNGARFGRDFGEHGKAARLQEKSLGAYERVAGPADEATMQARSGLIRTYTESGRTAQANTLLNKQVEALSTREKSGLGLNADTVLQRHFLRKQLERAGRKDDAMRIEERAYELVSKNPDHIPNHDLGMIKQRDQLLDKYMHQSPRKTDRIDKLLDGKSEGLNGLQKHDPNSSMVNEQREGLIRTLKEFGGDTSRLSGVLQDKEKALNEQAKLPFGNRDSLNRKNVELAKDYLHIGDRNRAQAVAERIIKHQESKEGKPGQQEMDIQERLNLGSDLAALADTNTMSNFRERTKSLLDAYEKSDAGKMNPQNVSLMRGELIEQYSQGKDYKTAMTLTDRELAHLNDRKTPDADKIALKLTKGDLHEKLREDKKAQGIYENLIRDSNDDSSKVTPLERLSAIYERTGQPDLAKKAKQDLESIRKNLPPSHFKSDGKLIGN